MAIFHIGFQPKYIILFSATFLPSSLEMEFIWFAVVFYFFVYLLIFVSFKSLPFSCTTSFFLIDQTRLIPIFLSIYPYIFLSFLSYVYKYKDKTSVLDFPLTWLNVSLFTVYFIKLKNKNSSSFFFLILVSYTYFLLVLWTE